MREVRPLDQLITIAEAHGEMWALLVRHNDGAIEAHTTDFYKVLVQDLDVTKEEIGEWLLVEEPVTCAEALTAGVELLQVCGNCKHAYEEP